MVPDSPGATDTLVRDMRIRQFRSGAWWAGAGWRLFQLLTVAAVVWAGWRLLAVTPYRIDIDVYRMGGRAWLDGTSLYRDRVLFHTVAGLHLPFTYPPLAAAPSLPGGGVLPPPGPALVPLSPPPPLAAAVFAPFAMLSLNAASATITAVPFVLLMVTTAIVLTRLGVLDGWQRRCWLAAAIV